MFWTWGNKEQISKLIWKKRWGACIQMSTLKAWEKDISTIIFRLCRFRATKCFTSVFIRTMQGLSSWMQVRNGRLTPLLALSSRKQTISSYLSSNTLAESRRNKRAHMMLRKLRLKMAGVISQTQQRCDRHSVRGTKLHKTQSMSSRECSNLKETKKRRPASWAAKTWLFKKESMKNR